MGLKHGVKIVKLNRNQAHRDAMWSTQMKQLVEHGRIRTTMAKAKALRPYAEKLVTLAKKNTDFTLTKAQSILQDPKLFRILTTDLVQRFQERPGGYTRIVKLNKRRFGDNAPMAYIEYVDNTLDPIIPPKEERTHNNKMTVLEEQFWRDCMGVDPMDKPAKREVMRDLDKLKSRFDEINALYETISERQRTRMATVVGLKAASLSS